MALSSDAQTAYDFLVSTVVPGLQLLTDAYGNMPRRAIPWQDDNEGRLLMLAYAGQETIWENTQQWGGGPGRGPWQLDEPTIGLVLTNPASSIIMHAVCGSIGLPADAAVVYQSLLQRPRLSATIARGDIWCDPRPLAPYGNAQAAWEQYDEEWRPGRPHPAYWARFYYAALEADEAWRAAHPEL